MIKEIILTSIRYCVIVMLLFFVIVAFYIAIFALLAKPKKSDVIMVLGAAAPNGVIPASLLANRLDKALELYKQGYAPFILVSGGQGEHERWPEAEVMRDWLVDRGVSKEVIIVENQSKSTWQNIEFSLPLLQQHHFDTILITSSASHLARANLVAHRFGLKNLSYSSSFRYTKLWRDFKSYLREVPAFILYDLFYYDKPIFTDPFKRSYGNTKEQ